MPFSVREWTSAPYKQVYNADSEGRALSVYSYFSKSTWNEVSFSVNLLQFR